MYYLCKVQYRIVLENGGNKVVTDVHLIEAVSFSDAEYRVADIMKDVKTQYNVKTVSHAKIAEIFGHEESGHWYMVKVVFITEDGHGKEKRIVNNILVAADTLDDASKNTSLLLIKHLIHYEIEAINLTAIKAVHKTVAEA